LGVVFGLGVFGLVPWLPCTTGAGAVPEAGGFALEGLLLCVPEIGGGLFLGATVVGLLVGLWTTSLDSVGRLVTGCDPPLGGLTCPLAEGTGG
jgi:hypothetical protein